MRRLHPAEPVIASGDGFGVKEFSAKEIEAAVRHGIALEAAPVRPLGRAMRRFAQSQPYISFKLTQSRTISSSFLKF